MRIRITGQSDLPLSSSVIDPHNLIKLPSLPQYYVNRFTPPLLQEVQILTPG
jgi:hypothetical protein